MPMAVYSFLDEYDFSGKTVIPFCTHGGSEFSDTISTLKSALPDTEILDGFEVYGEDADEAQPDVVNWSFIENGMCDEVNLVIAASADGSDKTPALFSAKEGFSKAKAVSFQLDHVEKMDGDSVWLRYKVLKNINF